MNSKKKRTLGSFYTQGNPFLLDPFIKWAETLPTHTKFLEPFAGNGQIPKLLTEAGFDFSWDSFDIDPEIEGVISQDTLSSSRKDMHAQSRTHPIFRITLRSEKASISLKNILWAIQVCTCEP